MKDCGTAGKLEEFVHSWRQALQLLFEARRKMKQEISCFPREARSRILAEGIEDGRVWEVKGSVRINDFAEVGVIGRAES